MLTDPVQFTLKIDLGHILTMVVMIISLVLAYSRLSESDALQEQAILNNQQQSNEWHHDLMEAIKQNATDLRAVRDEQVRNSTLLKQLK